MIFGVHFIIYSTDVTADRAFFRDVLRCPAVDAGNDWLVFSLPPAEMAVHPGEDRIGEQLYFMCDDLQSEIATLVDRGVHCGAVEEARWGSVVKIRLPGGGEVGLYKPRHPLALVPNTV